MPHPNPHYRSEGKYTKDQVDAMWRDSDKIGPSKAMDRIVKVSTFVGALLLSTSTTFLMKYPWPKLTVDPQYLQKQYLQSSPEASFHAEIEKAMKKAGIK
jgi:hypothetical protein